jgi:hypothetical protein
MNINATENVAPVTTQENGAVIPNREEALKAVAADVLNAFPAAGEGDQAPTNEEPAKAQAEAEPKAAGENAVALSQPETGQEPAWTPEQLAWFNAMETAKSPVETAAAQAKQPEFTTEQQAWLKTQAEAPATESEVKTEDHLHDDAELKGKLDEATQERINKRIGKEVAKTKAAQEAAEGLKAELETVKQQAATKPVTGPQPQGLLDGVQDATQLQQVAQQAESALDLADDLLSRLEDEPEAVETVLRQSQVKLKGTDGEEDFSPQAMKKYLKEVRRNADTTLRRGIPQRQEFLKQSDAYANEALDVVPELKDAKSERRKLFDQVVQQAPWIKQQPSWARMAAVYVLGLEAYQQQQAAKSQPVKPAVKPKRPVPVVIPAPRGTAPSAPRVNANAVSEDTVQSALSGNRSARLKVIQSLVPKFN